MTALSAYRRTLPLFTTPGLGDLAGNAAAVIIDRLRRAGIMSGLVVELGYGSGITARVLRAGGYSVLAINLSAAFIDIARERVPDAAFSVESFSRATISKTDERTRSLTAPWRGIG